jgi:hypothetical protein
VGRVLLVCRLAARDLRRRPTEAALLLLAIMAATTTLTLGLVLHDVASKPYERTREATAGPDVVANVALPPGSSEPAGLGGLKALADAPGVVDHSGPYPVVTAALKANGRTVMAQAQGRDSAAARVDQPKPTKGGWVRRGGAVLEAGFAQALGVGPGDSVTLQPMTVAPRNGQPSMQVHGSSRTFRVVGVAASAASPPYPEVACLGLCLPDVGLLWLTQADARSLDPGLPPSV